MPKAIGNCVEYLTRCPDSREAAAVACWTGQSLRLPSSRCQRTAQLHVWPAPTSEHRTTTASMQLHTLTYTHTDHIGLPSFSHTPFTRSSKRPANVFKIHVLIASRLLEICWTFAGLCKLGISLSVILCVFLQFFLPPTDVCSLASAAIVIMPRLLERV